MEILQRGREIHVDSQPKKQVLNPSESLNSKRGMNKARS